MLNNNRIGYLHYWCHKVLPLVYDNSLSYLEVLYKVKEKLNEVIKFTNDIPEYIDKKVIEAFDEEHLKELISEVFRTIEDAISANNEGTNTHFSTNYPTVGTLVWHDNKLYKTKHPIDAGDTILPDSNIELVNFGDMFNDFLTEVKTRFTDNDDGDRETSSTDRPVHDLVWLHNELYEVIKPIAEGNAYIYMGANKNVETTNLDKIYDYLLDLISSEIDAREHADDILDGKISDEANAREGADTALGGRIDDEATARENADNDIHDEIGNLANLSTNYKDNIVGSINEVNSRVGGEITDRINAINNIINMITPLGSNVITVAKVGGDFNNINAAVNSIRNVVTENNKYTILITTGVYDEELDLTGINGLALVGLGNVILQYASTYPMANLYITGKVSIYNLHLVQTGDAYNIHSDTQGTNSPVRLTAVNCTFQRIQMSAGTYQHNIGWGSCDVGGDEYNIYNCNFIGGTAIGGHLNPYVSATGVVAWRVMNCSFAVERVALDWGDACKIITGTTTNQRIAATFNGNKGNKGIIVQIAAGQSYNFFPANSFIDLYYSGGNNIVALNGTKTTTYWQIDCFVPNGTVGLMFVPIPNAHLYDCAISYAHIMTSDADIITACSIYGVSPNGISIQVSDYTTVSNNAIQIGIAVSPNIVSAI